ncbi:MAG: hypothetical protein NW241_04820 [Bacteroidia bacterium]|nr:hypothetical protein [Bacteroidia bacterium]
MKKVLSILIMSGVLLQALCNMSWIGAFYLRRAEIAEMFCVNKARPELKCDGKCYLAQQLRQQAEQEQTPGTAWPEMKQDFNLFVQPAADEAMQVQPLHEQPVFPELKAAAAAGIHLDLLRPPQA